jgi:hypothetical protein
MTTDRSIGAVATDVVEQQEAETLPPSATLLFAPVDKRAFGVAIGTVMALGVFAVTAIDLLRGLPWRGLRLFSTYFIGYELTWRGALIGLLWGFVAGFCAGWFVAFTRNLALAVSLFIIRTRAELDTTRDFLDHI